MRIALGSDYESGVWVVLVMILADTIRSVYRPFLRKIQSENDFGALRFWFETRRSSTARVTRLVTDGAVRCQTYEVSRWWRADRRRAGRRATAC